MKRRIFALIAVLIAAASCSSAKTYEMRGQILGINREKMEILVKHLGYRRQLWVETVCSIIALAFLAVLVVEGYRLTLLNRERTFGDSALSYSWVTAAVPIGCLLLAIALAYNMVVAWRRRSEGLLVYTRTPADSAAPPGIEL